MWPLRRSTSDNKQLLDDRVMQGEKTSSRDVFDLAEELEKGQARELVDAFMEPLPQNRTRLCKFRVERSKDRQQYWLSDDKGEFLMYAKMCKGSKRVDFFLYDPREATSILFDSEKPVFTMSCDASKKEWNMTQERCDRCHYTPRGSLARCSCCQGSRPEIMSAFHFNKTVGDGINHCMDVVLPCDGIHNNYDDMRLVTKLPKWCAKIDSMVLSFQGRQVQASAKNFQMATEQNPDEMVCQYGKIGVDLFALDFRYPLTVAQAFGMSVTTLYWS